jgi:hypothetical protein
MDGSGGLIILIALGFWCAVRRAGRKKANICSMTQSITFPVAVQRDIQAEVREIIRAIQAEVAVMNKTKDPETGIRCFSAIRSYIVKIAQESPLRTRLSLLMGDREVGHELVVGSGDELEALKRLEKEWLQNFFTERTETLLKQSEETEDQVLRLELARDGLRSALKGLEYHPSDKKLATMADLAEKRLRFLARPEVDKGDAVN